ncbi:hypothetical protein [Agrobacterium tumefaciens]|uniref:hypothetical protein n=1 Tax=Agrobacterium tumefaciens TaxID=358 RepID=UPI0009787E6F|nr:hypothetical protein [Agrobacterium tumefaciens]NSZ68736.1 hypothetical protein [Agrobacterium tumefaciens]OMP69503.1 hypothetical protein BV900_24720 [Agrobacterium tumefaciens]
MRILHARRTSASFSSDCIGLVDVEVNSDLRLYGMRLVRGADGLWRIHAPEAGHRRSATFSKPMAEEMTRLALQALETANAG